MCAITQQKQVALDIVQTLQNSGHTAYFAGGCVRDGLLGRKPKDYDVATSANPEEVETLFNKTLSIGKAFGVIGVVTNKVTVEVATFRSEEGTLDGRHPEAVVFSSAKEDALRRDFTVNGMFYDPIADQLHDYVGGQQDLERGIITAIGDPSERFQEDHLRLLRAIRFTHTLNFTLDTATANAVRDMAHLVKHVSAERIEQELSRILTESHKPGDALRCLHETNLLQHILPEFLPMIGQEQPPQFHPEGDVFDHTVLMLNLMKEKQTGTSAPHETTPHEFAPHETAPHETALHVEQAFRVTTFAERDSRGQPAQVSYTARELAYTVLLHDVGKPPTACMGPGTDGKPRIRFDGHAATGARMADGILVRLRLPNKERKHIVEAIHGHMRFMEVQNMRAAKLRRLIGKETFDLEMELHRLDCLGSHAMLDNYDYVRDYMEEMANEPVLPEPWLRGHDLIALGLSEGRLIGKILKEAYDAQMDNRFPDREELLAWIKSNYSNELNN